MSIKNRLKDLPQDLRILIYSNLPVKEVKNLLLNGEEDEDTLYLYVCRQAKINQRHIYRNLILFGCFKCGNDLFPDHIVNICSYCKFIFDKQETFPIYCTSCYKLGNPRDLDFRPCILCNNYSAVLGILPYS